MVLLEAAAAFVQATGPFSNPGLLSMYPVFPGLEEAEVLQKEAGSSQGELEPVLVKRMKVESPAVAADVAGEADSATAAAAVAAESWLSSSACLQELTALNGAGELKIQMDDFVAVYLAQIRVGPLHLIKQQRKIIFKRPLL